MTRTIKLLAAGLLLAAAITGVAVAASSPTVATGAATNIGNTAATLNATVNPNGNQTGYSFQYGVTTAYGLSTNSHSAGHGTKPVTVAAAISGLTPGTVYHYRISALNKAGGSIGVDRTFKTTGAPPPTPITGSPVSVGKTMATITGSVTTNGAATSWVVQYGLTTAYGVETFAQTLPPSAAAVPVSVQLTGLASATLFHYRVVAFHGSQASGTGNDGTFFTEPARAPKPRFTTRTTPSRESRKPYTFTTRGTLHGATFIPASVRCTGNVGLRYYHGKRQIGFIVAPVGPTCQFSAQESFRHIGVPLPAQVRITIDYRGNGYLASVKRTNTVTAG